jgi:hypothetical protein
MLEGLGAAIGFYLVYNYTPNGALYWLVIITVLSIGASYFPARGATHVSGRAWRISSRDRNIEDTLNTEGRK